MRGAVVWLWALACWAGLVSVAPAAEAPAVSIRRIDVPDQRPGEWPAGPWTAIPRPEFEAWLERQAAPGTRPPAAVVEAAEYRGDVVAETIRGGTLRWSVRRAGAEDVLLPLGPLNLALGDLRWADGPATWGTGRDGKVYLLVDRPAGEVLGRWSRRGESFQLGTDFSIRLPDAASSSLELTVPEKSALKSSAGLLAPLPAGEGRGPRFRLELGPKTATQLSLQKPGGAPPPKPSVLYEQELVTTIREEEIRFQAIFQPEVVEGSVGRLSITLPRSVDVFSVMYGSETPLAWAKTGESNGRSTLEVTLPGEVSGRLRPLRLEGLIAQRVGQNILLPQIDLADAVFLGGRETISVESPLRVRSFRPTGLREMTPVSPYGDGETYVFQRYQRDGQLHVDVRRPPSRLTAQVLTLAQLSDAAWNLQSEILWTTSSGSVFQVGCQIPPDWEVTDVQLMTGQGSGPLASWDVQPQAGGGSLLSLELLEAVVPGTPRHVCVWARRQSPGAEHGVPLPVLRPMGTESVDQVLGVAQSSAFSVTLSPESGFERSTSNVLGETWQSFVIRPNAQAATPQDYRWFRGNQEDEPGRLEIQARLRPVEALAHVDADLSEGRIHETFTLRCASRGEAIDRVLVYVSTPGAPIPWQLAQPALELPAARKLPAEAHGDWGYPETGELWELELPVIPDPSFTISGARTIEAEGPWEIGLAFTPQAKSFQGSVSFRQRQTEPYQTIVNGLQPADAAVIDRDRPGPVDGVTQQTWSYRALSDHLQINSLTEPEPQKSDLIAEAAVRVLLSAQEGAPDLYRCRYRVLGPWPREGISFRLPDGATLLGTRLNGESSFAVKMEGEYLLPESQQAAADRSIEILYQLASPGGLLVCEQELRLPALSAVITSVDFELAVPPGVRMFEAPSRVFLVQPPRPLHWTERFFGPLGRGEGGAFFHPLRVKDWRELLRGSAPSAPSPVLNLDANLTTPAGWTVYRGSGPTLSGRFELSLWNLGRLRLLGWISLVAAVMAGLGLRLRRWPRRHALGAGVLTILAVAALFWPSPLALITGAALAGTLLAMFLPRPVWELPMFEGSTVVVPSGSTQSYRLQDGLLTGVALFLVAWAAAGVAQERPATPAREASPFANASPGPEEDVLIPVDADGRPSRQLPLVYVSRALAAAIQQSQADRPPAVDYLVAGAEYEAEAVPERGVTLSARYRVFVPEGPAAVTVELPLENVRLGGGDACLVDGAPHAIATAPGRDDRFLLQLAGEAPPGGTPADALQAAGGSTTASPPTASPRRWRAREVRLALRPAPGPGASPAELRFGVPPVADARLRVNFGIPRPHVRLPASAGAVTPSEDLTSLSADLGPVTAVACDWSPAGQAPLPAAEVDFELFQTADIRPEWIEVRFRGAGQVAKGPLRNVTLRLPPNAILKDFQGASVLRWQWGPPSDRLVEFSETAGPEVVVSGTVLVPVVTTGGAVDIPSVLFGSTAQTRVVVSRAVLSAGCPGEYGLTLTPAADQTVTTAAPNEQLLPLLPDLPGSSRGQAVFSSTTPPRVAAALAVTQPKRRVGRWQTTVEMSPRRLAWQLEASIETTGAPAFQHALQIDRRLQITRVSVEEGGAERLVRWSETRLSDSHNRLVLFLSDKTNGVQKLTVQAHLPLRRTNDAPLPSARLEDADVPEARIAFLRESDLEVDVEEPRGLVPDTTGKWTPAVPVGWALDAVYLATEPDPRAWLRLRQRHLRVEAQRVTRVVQRHPDRLGVTSWVHLSIPQPSPGLTVLVDVPRDERQPAHVTAQGAEFAEVSRTDTFTRYALTPPQQPDQQVVFEVRTEMPVPLEGVFPIPVPQLPELAASASLVVLPAESDLELTNPGVPASLPEPPDWTEELPGDVHPTLERPATYAGPQPQVARRSAGGVSAGSAARLVEHGLWILPGGDRFGVTSWHLEGPTPAWRFTVPGDARLLAAFENGRHVALRRDDAGLYDVPPVLRHEPTVITVFWERKGWSGVLGWSWQQEPLPTSPQMSARRETLLLAPRSNVRLRVGRNAEHVPRFDLLMDRLQLLATEMSYLDGAGDGAAPFRTWARETVHAGAERLANPADRSGLSAEQLARWNEMIPRLEPSLATPAGPGDGPPRLSDPMARLLVAAQPNAVTALLKDAPERLDYWEVHSVWPVIPVLFVVAPLILLGMYALVRPPTGQWLSHHPYVAWIGLGLLWWIFLAPSVVGWLVFVVALVRRLRTRPARRAGMLVG